MSEEVNLDGDVRCAYGTSVGAQRDVLARVDRDCRRKVDARCVEVTHGDRHRGGNAGAGDTRGGLPNGENDVIARAGSRPHIDGHALEQNKTVEAEEHLRRVATRGQHPWPQVPRRSLQVRVNCVGKDRGRRRQGERGALRRPVDQVGAGANGDTVGVAGDGERL